MSKKKYTTNKERTTKNLMPVTTHIPYVVKLAITTQAEEEGISFYKKVQQILQDSVGYVDEVEEQSDDLLG